MILFDPGLVQVNSNPLVSLAILVPPSLLGSYPVSPLAFLHVFQPHSQSSPPVCQLSLLVLGQAQCLPAGVGLDGKQVVVLVQVQVWVFFELEKAQPELLS